MNTVTTPDLPATRSLRPLLLLISLFALPALLAYIILTTDIWRTQGSNHHGQLLQPPLQLSELKSLSLDALDAANTTQTHTTKQWWLGYVTTNTECSFDPSCKQNLWLLHQVHTRLGPDQNRLRKVLFTPQKIIIQQSTANSTIALTEDLIQIQINAAALQAFFDTSTTDFFILVDPLGQIILKYSADHVAAETLLNRGKAILKDLQRLLKVSRIG